VVHGWCMGGAWVVHGWCMGGARVVLQGDPHFGCHCHQQSSAAASSSSTSSLLFATRKSHK